jgi:sialic acid synthase SpsE
MVDVEEAVTLCLARGNTKVSLLQCGTMYPLPPEHAHLRVMNLYRQRFGGPVGWSDHALGLTLAIAATGRGAAVIEKHFTHDRSAEGPDHFYALEPGELTQLVEAIHEVHAALGRPEKEMLPSEREFGRRDGLYAARDIPAGARLSDDDIEIRRPAVGLRARYRATVTGAEALHAIEAGAPLQWANIRL